MSDEIMKDDMGELEKRFNDLKKSGKLGSCPNMSHLPDEEKQKIIQDMMLHCTEMLMKTYLSLGIKGESMMGLQDGFSGNKFKLKFKAFKNEEADEDFDRAGDA